MNIDFTKIAWITSGTNSFSAINKQITTKLARDTIDNFTPSTGSKILTSQFISSTSHTIQSSLITNPNILNQLNSIKNQLDSISNKIKSLQKSQ